jgi:murein DD-endopeptidase MepM/ murein hydrolase activator NlpD
VNTRLLALAGAVSLLLATLLSPAATGAGHRAGELEPRFEWPLRPEPPVTRPFDPPEHDFGSGHRGVDLGGGPGQPVHAAGEGVVVFAGTLAGRGVVSIDHDVLRTTYEPVEPAVAAGDRVFSGQRIGALAEGHEGCPLKACLHWGGRRGEEYLDPLRLVTRSEIRLKPWDEEDR